ncbi:MAG: N-acetyltransferase [Bacteroidales bacterium]|jgi:predicted N-acetyltransferase YhbS|nr:N-acetyltransferase [Bacteroidales bacterium]
MTPINFQLRLEEEKDHRQVEILTREAFWNLNFPGCGEHLVVHQLRKTKEFVRSLDFVAVYEGKIVGNIVYAEAKIKKPDQDFTILTFGPVSVLPEYQNKGIGSKLINHTLKLAGEMNYKAIVIYGDPDYYRRFGFKSSKEYGITNKEKRFPAALLVLELYPGALKGIEGIFDEGKGYEINEDESEIFDKQFEAKEKKVTPTQEKFIKTVSQYL